jgi:NADH-quinone oxidoreductase subunit L
MTHAFFKALLFLAAGSVIIGMHHAQDIRKMGGIRKYMPVTHWTALVGSLALIGFPGFSGFFSKDAIIESVHLSELWGSDYASWLLTAGVFVTALYSFRMYFLVFHGEGPRHFEPHHDEHDEHGDAEAQGHHLVVVEPSPHESPWVVTVPLILLAIPSVFIGWYAIEPMLFGSFFDGVIHVAAIHDTLGQMGKGYHGQVGFIEHGMLAAPFWLAMGGLILAFVLYRLKPNLPGAIKARAGLLYRVLDSKYGFDEFNQAVFAGGSRFIGKLLWLVGDRALIDGLAVNGSAHSVGVLAGVARHLQTGFLFHYAIAIILGLLALMTWFVFL